MTPDIIRDSTVGQLINRFTHGRVLPYAEQRPDYVLPARYRAALDGSAIKYSTSTAAASVTTSRTATAAPSLKEGAEGDKISASGNAQAAHTFLDLEKSDLHRGTAPHEPTAALKDLEKADLHESAPVAKDPFLVEFEENDPGRPLNWSRRKRIFVATLISYLTFSIYIGSAIYTPSIPGLMQSFGVSQVVATLGLSLFVLAYGIGPMILAPLQEMPRQGRTPVYIIGLLLFFIFQFPIVFAPNIATILVFRFFSGFVGSPALATGGASMIDIFEPRHAPIAIAVWSIGAVSGPVLGPVIGSFAAQANGWQWPNWELMWISGFAFLVLSLFLPETFEPTVLIRRAERIRQLTGDNRFRTQAEIDAVEGESFLELLWTNFKRAFQLAAEPAVFFANSYIALLYACFYLWFEAFPILYVETYHFSLGISGLPYLAFIVSGLTTFSFYILYLLYHLNPRMGKPDFQPEARLELGLVAGLFIPVSLLIFGWSGQNQTHWIVPTIGAGLYLPGIFLIFQCILMYVSSSYPPALAASILAGNDLFRSSFASVFPLFGTRFFKVLGLGGGSSLLAGVNLLMVPLLFMLMKFGPRLRARSKWIQ
ncbi:BQ5605_C007g04707 [Microbotryum silenes-dioicae]|uniref:BQ5605_C007g04707 protein n=1 Tax=Microbotryum silenes-dioicae TaxID=796604 RepID=A0A2X0M7N1_9BASI|nr:BQ5605_C007g04707 [Microbotryum silenes-dioicae]